MKQNNTTKGEAVFGFSFCNIEKCAKHFTGKERQFYEKQKENGTHAGFSAACRGALPDGSAGADRAGGSHTGAGESPEADPQ